MRALERTIEPLLWRLALGVAAALAVGCSSENEIQEIRLDAIAVTAGDYDRMEEILLRQLVAYQLYDGYIGGAAYDPGIDPADISLKVETLLGEQDEIDVFGAIFLNSGTRGLGAYVYNDVETDDALVSDSTVVDNLTSFVGRGGVLVVSDWAYDIIEVCWPDEIDWVGDDTVLDDAQRGLRGAVAADVEDGGLQMELDQDTLSIDFDYSYWSIMESVADDVDIFLRGDVSYRLSEEEGDSTLEGVPLLVGFKVGFGRVIFSSFHWRQQNAQMADTLMLHVVDGLRPGSGEEQDDTADTGG